MRNQQEVYSCRHLSHLRHKELYCIFLWKRKTVIAILYTADPLKFKKKKKKEENNETEIEFNSQCRLLQEHE